ncbi:hypothetical protein F5Y04DRAFT_77242 [Hypomontagnella monticulosa]|nr:hypothetical protein F5Y04DRAFT_77242 [Hypomontagnella monticulosa]
MARCGIAPMLILGPTSGMYSMHFHCGVFRSHLSRPASISDASYSEELPPAFSLHYELSFRYSQAPRNGLKWSRLGNGSWVRICRDSCRLRSVPPLRRIQVPYNSTAPSVSMLAGMMGFLSANPSCVRLVHESNDRAPAPRFPSFGLSWLTTNTVDVAMDVVWLCVLALREVLNQNFCCKKL